MLYCVFQCYCYCYCFNILVLLFCVMISMIYYCFFYMYCVIVIVRCIISVLKHIMRTRGFVQENVLSSCSLEISVVVERCTANFPKESMGQYLICVICIICNMVNALGGISCFPRSNTLTQPFVENPPTRKPWGREVTDEKKTN